jgi:hypothetical protein
LVLSWIQTASAPVRLETLAFQILMPGFDHLSKSDNYAVGRCLPFVRQLAKLTVIDPTGT